MTTAYLATGWEPDLADGYLAALSALAEAS